jgi:hypothetical protein
MLCILCVIAMIEYWYLNRERHRTDEPAIIDSDEHQFWYLNGEPHKTDKPVKDYKPLVDDRLGS